LCEYICIRSRVASLSLLLFTLTGAFSQIWKLGQTLTSEAWEGHGQRKCVLLWKYDLGRRLT
ncbi:hypothetical protein P692DRAFT_20924647, partial [Suillus brevipes Sb2]